MYISINGLRFPFNLLFTWNMVFNLFPSVDLWIFGNPISICIKASVTSCGTDEMYSVNYPLIFRLRWSILLDSLLGIVWNSTVPWDDGSLEMCRISSWPGNYVRLIGDDVLFIHKTLFIFQFFEISSSFHFRTKFSVYWLQNVAFEMTLHIHMNIDIRLIYSCDFSK